MTTYYHNENLCIEKKKCTNVSLESKFLENFDLSVWSRLKAKIDDKILMTWTIRHC